MRQKSYPNSPSQLEPGDRFVAEQDHLEYEVISVRPAPPEDGTGFLLVKVRNRTREQLYRPGEKIVIVERRKS